MEMLFSFIISASASSFNYTNHGLDWPENCYSSLSQSPVDINTNFLKKIDDSDSSYWYLDLHYSKVHVINTNTTVQASITSGFAYNANINFNILSDFGNVSQVFNDKSVVYQASQISFKYPAEHTINGKQVDSKGNYLLEVQITHISSVNPNQSLVLSTIFQPSSQKNYFLTEVINAYYSTIGGGIDCTFATNGWLTVKNFYSYKGSQTIPDCKDGVTWVIPQDFINCTQDQIRFFAEKLNNSPNGGNYRYTFPLYGRTVEKYMAEVFSEGGLLIIYWLLMFS